MRKVEYVETVTYKDLPPSFEIKLGFIEMAARNILRFVPRGIPNFPSHGVDHSISIIDNINNFIDTFLDASSLNYDEIYLLYLGAWLHDIGNILNRERHHILSAGIIRDSSRITSILDPKTIDRLRCIVKYHSSECNIENVPEKTNGILGSEIRLRLISSIFRIMDACEIFNTKCPIEVYQILLTEKDEMKKLSPENIKYWEAHKSIMGLKFKNPDICVEVDDEERAKILTEKIKKEIKSVEGVLLAHQVTIPIVTIIESKSYDEEEFI